MRKILPIIAAALLLPLSLRAQEEEKIEFFSLPDSVDAAYLDSTVVSKLPSNNYWMLGAYGGATLNYGYWNPTRNVRWSPNLPVFGFSVVRYFSMFGMFPNMGLEFGFQQNWEGYEFKRNKEGDNSGYIFTETGAYKARMRVPEVYMATHFHVDMGSYTKLIAKVGVYGGYRMDIERTPEESWVDDTATQMYAKDFRSYDLRLTYGLHGGLGFALMFDPVEIHLNVQVKWGWGSFWEPDYYDDFYYRFGYPLDISPTLGVYYQLTSRHGHSRAQLRSLARKMAKEQYGNY